VAERLASGTMPPKTKPQPSAEDVKTVAAWLDAGLVAADAARQKAEGRAVLRRLNRVEYTNTLRDLLAIDVDLKNLLPEDETVDGFDNVGSALTISPVLLERYLEAADAALNAAIVKGPKPETTRMAFAFKEEKSLAQRFARVGGNIRLTDDGVVLLTSAPAGLRQLRPGFRGRYRFRISAGAADNQGRPMLMHVEAPGSPAFGGYFKVPAEKPAIIEFEGLFGPRDTFQIGAQGLGVFYIRDMTAHKGPGLLIQWVEVEGPLLESWPPESHRRVFGSVDPKTATLADAEKILRDFVPRAFRKPVSDARIRPYVELVRSRFDRKYSFEEALRVGLRAVLCSSGFLILDETPGLLDDYSLAARLSCFLWKSMPDRQLLDLANEKKLHFPQELHQQVERMLKDPKAAALTEHFLGQWLDLKLIDATTPDKKLYPEYDDLLKYSMLKETQLFFEEILRSDLSLLNFVDSEFSILNEPLARHYGIPGVEGPEFRKVKLPRQSHRGGVLTQAAVLKVTANGTTTSPVLRGVWILKNIMGRSIPPPPPDVPAVEPDIRGTTSIRDQLAKHRQLEGCAVCHRKIDPPGFALESFDVIGGWREHYRSLGAGLKLDVTVQGNPVQYRQGPKIDAGDVTADGKRFEDVDGFKKLLLEDPDQIARCVAERLIVYATGTPIRPADRAAVDALVKTVRVKGYGLRTLIHEIVQSELFLHK